jgi:hypothetical protein
MSIQGPTDYQHPWPNYQLNDLHQAMDYNAAGQPIIRVTTASSGYGNTVINGNTISGGTVVFAALFASRDTISLPPDIQRRLQLGRDVAGNTDILTLTVTTTGNNPDCLFSLGWAELTN